jgi:hypothetical protein
VCHWVISEDAPRATIRTTSTYFSDGVFHFALARFALSFRPGFGLVLMREARAPPPP